MKNLKIGAAAKPATKAGQPGKQSRGKKVVLLSGGNPRIAKADGDAPVQEYIAAMPGWKRTIGNRLDALIVANVPNVRKAVKWNSPMYGIEGQGLFLGFHTFTNYVKVTFFRGTLLRPVPPGGTGTDARWIDVHEHDLDETQMAAWLKQAAALPGWVMSAASKSRKTDLDSKSPRARREATRRASSPIPRRSGNVGGWRAQTLARMRALILEADPQMTEERKWIKPTNPAGVPVWSHAGMVCTGETYTKVVKLTFARGASIPDPAGLFNSSLEGNTRRAIDLHEGEDVDPAAFKALVQAAVALNNASAKKR